MEYRESYNNYKFKCTFINDLFKGYSRDRIMTTTDMNAIWLMMSSRITVQTELWQLQIWMQFDYSSLQGLQCRQNYDNYKFECTMNFNLFKGWSTDRIMTTTNFNALRLIISSMFTVQIELWQLHYLSLQVISSMHKI